MLPGTSKGSLVIREAVLAIVRDLKRVWPAIMVFSLYFLVGRRFLYSLCPSVIFTGFPCPGCGLTRATFCILRGRFADAWYLNPFAYAVLVFCICFAVRRYLLHKETKSLVKWMIIILIGMVVFYIYRMIRYFPGEAPMSYYYGSVGYRLWEIIREMLQHRL